MRNKEFELISWNGGYAVFKATTKYGDQDVFLVHDKGLFRLSRPNFLASILVRNDPYKDSKYDASQNKLKKMMESMVGFFYQPDQVKAQMKLYAELTEGNKVTTLPTGYWMITNAKKDGYAWCRARSNG